MKQVLFLFSCLITFAFSASLETFVAHPSLKTASVGIYIVSLTGDETIATHNPDLALIPASTLKAVTTATALETHGPDFTFPTKLFLSGDDLIIKGGGDPTLSASSPISEFRAWHTALKKIGLTELKGNLIADPSRFEEQRTPNNWPWGDIGNYYGAGPSGLNYHKNLYTLSFRPGKIGSLATLVGTSPKPPGVRFENFVRTGSSSSGDQAYVYTAPRGSLAILRGTIPFGGRFSIKGALPNPPLSCATAFRSYLTKKKFPVGGQAIVKSTNTANARLIHEQASPKLSVISRATNHRSVNLYADSIFKSLTAKGTTTSAASKMKFHWRRQGVDMTGFVAHDGSGLSPRNTITPRQLASIVKKAATGPQAEAFLDSLPTAGKSGTLRTFGKGTAIEGRVLAKSGSLTRVRTYTGILTQKSGKKYAFSILTNNTLSSPKKAIVSFLASCLN